jgi:preprotein translocase subunit SecG
MYQFILFIHVLVAAFIVLLVLVQQGKGATMGAAFGSGASQTVFGSRGSGSFLFRLTLSCVAVFFTTSIALNYVATRAYKTERVITLPAGPVQKSPLIPAAPQAPAAEKPATADMKAPETNETTNKASESPASPVTPLAPADQIPVKQ